MKQYRKRNLIGLVAMALVLIAGTAIAYTAPAAGSAGYDVFDVVANQFLGGAIGTTAGIVGICWGCLLVMAKGNLVAGIPIAAVSGILANADSIATSLGAML